LQLNRNLFKKTGTILNIVIIIGVFLLVLIAFLNLTFFINSLILFKTKNIYIAICFIIPLIYGLYKGINAISKTSLILFYFAIISMITIFLGIYNNIEIENIKPILQASNSSLIYGSILIVAYNILPLAILLIIPKNKIENYKTKNTIIFYFLASLSLVIAAFITVSVLGVDLSLLYDYPEFHILKKVKVGDFADRLENILAMQWIVGLFFLIIIGIYFITSFFITTFNLKEKTNKRISTFICLIIMFISELSLNLNESVKTIFENIMIPILYFCFFIIPLITVIKIKLKKLNC
ncbi:MAG: GerAB/ArcD/ProY family transporter, partial [Bacilli bacterium]|nr:GerAB/ArcD/ProY family transporter [Bacilli bacterium]